MAFEVTQEVRREIEQSVDEALSQFPDSMIDAVVDHLGNKVHGRDDFVARAIKHYEETGTRPGIAFATETARGHEIYTSEDFGIAKDLSTKGFEQGMRAVTENMALIARRSTVEHVHVGLGPIEGALAALAPRLNGAFEESMIREDPEPPPVETLLTYDSLLFAALFAAARHRMIKGKTGLKGSAMQTAHDQFLTLRGFHFHDALTVTCECNSCKRRKEDWARAEHKT